MSNNLVERSNKVWAKVLGHFTELEVESGKGSFLFGSDGKKYLDFASGIAVTNTGHCHPKVVKAAKDQVSRLIHNCAGVTYNATNIAFAEKLQQVVPIKDARIFLSQSGSEAVEGALKAAKYVTKKSGIIALQGGFHGRTMGALSVTSSKQLYRQGYGDLMPNTFLAEANLDSIKKLNNGNIAALILELVKGEGGYRELPAQFVQEVSVYCRQENILLIVDEVQSGFGRTGKMFASEWYGLEPDLMALAKGIASGFPLGAVIMKKELAEQWPTSAHGGTFTGNLVSCAAGLETIDILLKELPKMESKTKKLNSLIKKLLREFPDVFVEKTGLGFMVGIRCASKEINTKLRQEALAQGLLLINCGPEGDILRLAPPVTIKPAELKLFDQLLRRAVQKLA